MLAWVTGQIDDSLHQKLELVLEENRLITHLMAMRMTPAATATTETQITRNSRRTMPYGIMTLGEVADSK